MIPGPGGRLQPGSRRPRTSATGERRLAAASRAASFLLAFCLLAWTVGTRATASVADLLGLGSRAVAMGGAYTALAEDFSAVYYNPAGLSQTRNSDLAVGGLWARPWFTYQEQGQSTSTPHLYSTGALYIGVTSNLGHMTGYRQLAPWTLGICLYLPVERALLADIPNESSEKKFIFYLDQSQVLAFLMSLSWKISGWLSVGAGANLLADLRAPNEAFVSVDLKTVIPYLMGLSDLIKTVRPRIMRDAEVKAAPIVGVQVQPVSWLRVGVTYRGKFYAETVGSQDILLRFMDFSGRTSLALQTAVLADIHYIHFWNPNQVSGGLALFPTEALRVGVDLTWADWSDYVDSMWNVPAIRYTDTFTPRLGVEYRLESGILLRGGYYFQPTPVPEQTQASNYLDNDKHVVSVGAGYTFPRLPLLPIWKKPLTVEGYIQYTQLVTRVYHKVDPKYGNSLELGGCMLNGGLSLTLHY
jgi:long-chain fatty acid transport protein